MILLYCIIASFIVFYRITVCFILLYYSTCIGLDIELYLAIQLFSCKYVTIKLSWVKLTCALTTEPIGQGGQSPAHFLCPIGSHCLLAISHQLSNIYSP